MLSQNEELTKSADHWDALADYELRMAAWDESLGFPRGSVQTYYNRAELYRRTAEAQRREGKTGRFHCVSCGLPHDPVGKRDCPGLCSCGSESCPWCSPVKKEIVDGQASKSTPSLE